MKIPFCILILLIVFCIQSSSAKNISDNACYNCLLNNNTYCELNQTLKCCVSTDQSDVCKKGDCTNPFRTPPQKKSKDNYSDGYSFNYVNLFLCQHFEINPCTGTVNLPNIGGQRNTLIQKQTSDYCIFENKLQRKDNQKLDFILKVTNFTADYKSYFWLTNSFEGKEEIKIIEKFAYNESSVQPTFTSELQRDMKLLTILIRNDSIKSLQKIQNSVVQFQIQLIDNTVYKAVDSDYSNNTSSAVIIIAIVIGSVITVVCLVAVVYMIVRAFRKNKIKHDKQLINDEEPNEPEEDDKYSSLKRKETLNQIRKKNSVHQISPDLFGNKESIGMMTDEGGYRKEIKTDQIKNQKTDIEQTQKQRTQKLKPSKSSHQNESQNEKLLFQNTGSPTKDTIHQDIQGSILADFLKPKKASFKNQRVQRSNTQSQQQVISQKTITHKKLDVKRQFQRNTIKSQEYTSGQNDSKIEDISTEQALQGQENSFVIKLDSVQNTHRQINYQNEIKEEYEEEQEDEQFIENNQAALTAKRSVIRIEDQRTNSEEEKQGKKTEEPKEITKFRDQDRESSNAQSHQNQPQSQGGIIQEQGEQNEEQTSEDNKVEYESRDRLQQNDQIEQVKQMFYEQENQEEESQSYGYESIVEIEEM